MPLPDPQVAARLGVIRRSIDDEEIVSRCMLSLINTGAQLLADGVADSAADIDAIWCNGYGFPRRRGGPMFYADALGLQTVVSSIQRFGSQLGTRDWIPAEFLTRLSSRGQRFADYDNTTITGLTRETATT